MRPYLIAVALVVSLSSVSSAEGPSRVEEKKGSSYNEIERGFFFEARGGFYALVNPPALAGRPTYFSPGQALGVDMGFDIGERVAPSLFFFAASNRMGSDYQGLDPTGASTGDFSSMTPGAALKVRLVGFNDAQSIARTWLYLRGGAGATFYSPNSLLPGIDVLVTGGLGVEYYTRLRHLSIGLEGNFVFMALTRTVGFSTFLTVKYAFPL
jgi:hypothetical protein